MLGFVPYGDDRPTVAAVAAGGSANGGARADNGLAGLSNVGGDPFWTGHPLAQANLYAFGRLAWDSRPDSATLLDEWIELTLVPFFRKSGVPDAPRAPFPCGWTSLPPTILLCTQPS